MLVLSRERGLSISITDGTLAGDHHVMVAELRGDQVVLAITQPSNPAISRLPARIVHLRLTDAVEVTSDVRVSIVDIRADKVRIGVVAPNEMTVHRLEVYEAIRRENENARRARPLDDGLAGGAVPKTPRPKPPSLFERLHEPRPLEDE